MPVALTLQQLDSTLDRLFNRSMYSPLLGLVDTSSWKAEVDLAWFVNGKYSEKTAVILAECKDQGARPEEFQNDLNSLRRIADAFPDT